MDKEQLTTGRKAGTALKMPVFSIDDAKYIGSVKDVIYDGQHNQLLGFTMENRGFFSPRRKFIKFEDVKSLGRDAIMVQNRGVILDERQVPGLNRVMNQKKTLAGRRVLTEGGNNLGRITDVIVDDSTGRGVSYEVTAGVTKDIGTGRSYVPVPEVYKLGRDVVIVPDTTETLVSEQAPGGLAGTYQTAVAGGRELGGKAGAYTQEQTINAVRGKIAGRDVYDDQDYLIVAKGQVIDDPVINTAVEKGKLYNLAAAAGVGGVLAGYESAKGAVPESFWQDTKQSASRMWSDITGKSRESLDKAEQKRVVNAQKDFLKGKVSATDVFDDSGNILLHEGEIITPMILDTLDHEGKLGLVHLMPEGQPAEGPVEEGEHAPEIHVIVESAEQHERHLPKQSI